MCSVHASNHLSVGQHAMKSMAMQPDLQVGRGQTVTVTYVLSFSEKLLVIEDAWKLEICHYYVVKWRTATSLPKYLALPKPYQIPNPTRSLIYAVPKNVNFSNGNNRFASLKEVIFDAASNLDHDQLVETTDGNIVKVCKRLLQVVISDNAIDNSLETRDTIGDTEG